VVSKDGSRIRRGGEPWQMQRCGELSVGDDGLLAVDGMSQFGILVLLLPK